MGHPRKRFSQNFLQDQPLIERLIATFSLQKTDNVVEIGPGKGALTKPLLAVLDRLTAIEIDTDLHALLTETLGQTGKLSLMHADALTVDYRQFGTALRLIGNLPYHISTPLLLHLFQYGALIQDMYFMLQKEVVERLVAKPGTKDYGRLSVMTQYHCEATLLFEVPPTVFYPIPKVFSAIVRLTPHKVTPFTKVDLLTLETVVKQAFHMRRKTLANNFKGMLNAEQLQSLGLDPQARPEILSVQDFVRLAQAL